MENFTLDNVFFLFVNKVNYSNRNTFCNNNNNKNNGIYKTITLYNTSSKHFSHFITLSGPMWDTPVHSQLPWKYTKQATRLGASPSMLGYPISTWANGGNLCKYYFPMKDQGFKPRTFFPKSARGPLDHKEACSMFTSQNRHVSTVLLLNKTLFNHNFHLRGIIHGNIWCKT